MNIENSINKKGLKIEDPKYDRLFNQIVEIDKDLEEMIKMICLKGDGHKLPKDMFERYKAAIELLDQVGALNIKKSKYEDTMEAFEELQEIYLDIEEACIVGQEVEPMFVDVTDEVTELEKVD